MAYLFEKNEPLAAAFKRISAEQIHLAIMYLTATEDLEKSIHETRKSIKRMRALLYLTRSAIGEDFFEKENARFRDIGRSLSSTRDSHVMLQTLSYLKARDRENDFSSTIKYLKSEIDQRNHKAGTAKGLKASALAQLETASLAFEALKIKSMTTEDLTHGLTTTYRKCRKSMGKAYQLDDPQNFHDWRKSLQRHWRHLKVLASAWPEKSAALIATARQLSDVLGTHNDISTLEIFVANLPTDKTPSKIKTKPFLAFCRAQEAALRTEAHPLGVRLFDEPAENFSKRFQTYLETAPLIAQPSKARVKKR